MPLEQMTLSSMPWAIVISEQTLLGQVLFEQISFEQMSLEQMSLEQMLLEQMPRLLFSFPPTSHLNVSRNISD